jgi:hypothetical protein
MQVNNRLKRLAEPGAERSIVDGAADLQQKAGAAPGASHLLALVHPAVHKEIRRRFGELCPDAQFGPVRFSVIDQPVALAAEIAVKLGQGGSKCQPPSQPSFWSGSAAFTHRGDGARPAILYSTRCTAGEQSKPQLADLKARMEAIRAKLSAKSALAVTLH